MATCWQRYLLIFVRNCNVFKTQVQNNKNILNSQSCY